MVSTASIACMAITGIIAVALPVVAFLYARKRFGARLFPVVIGAACFYIFAMMLEPLLHTVAIPAIGERPILYVVYGCLAAGVFEEFGRFCGFTFLARKDRVRTANPNPEDHGGLGRAIAYGIGHGGLEAILLCAMLMVSNISLAMIINGSGVESVLSQLPEASRAVGEVQVNGLIDAPAASFLISGVERVIAFSLHVSLSVLVWMAVSGLVGKAWIAGAMILHALANAGAGLYQVGMLSLAAAEIWAAVAVIAIVFVVYKLWQGVSGDQGATEDPSHALEASDE